MRGLAGLVAVIVSRVVLVGFAVMAALSIPEARQLLNESYTRDEDTLFIPMKLCNPTGISLDGETITLDAEAGNDCRTLDFLTNACAMSFLFSIMAVGIFVISDCFVRRGMGSSGTVAGMGMFLIFILLQTAVCTWALVAETRFWVEYFNTILEEHFQEFGIENVSTHGNSLMLIATGAAAMLSAALLVAEACLSLCYYKKADTETEGTATYRKNELLLLTQLP